VILLVLLFLYLLVAPLITRRFVPCLNPYSIESFTFDTCNTALILDRFLAISIVGLITVVLLFYAKVKKNYPKLSVLAFGLICVATVIFSYYQYIPEAEKLAKSAPIILDRSLKPVSQEK